MKEKLVDFEHSGFDIMAKINDRGETEIYVYTGSLSVEDYLLIESPQAHLKEKAETLLSIKYGEKDYSEEMSKFSDGQRALVRKFIGDIA